MSVLAEKIISYLQAQTPHPFPNYGILGGQSVAEAYFLIKDIPVKTRIKDIDLFINLKNDRWRKKYQDYTRWRNSSESISLGIRHAAEIKEKGYTRGSFADDEIQDTHMTEEVKEIKSSYKILDTFNIDIINVVEIEYDQYRDVNHAGFLKQTIDEFDINAIQIGVCLRTRRVYMSQSFKDFLKTKQVEIVKTVRPARTLCRYLKKSEFYKGAYFNFEYEANLVLSHFLLNDYRQNKKIKGIKFHREAYDSLSGENKKLLGKYFNVSFESFENFDKIHLHIANRAFFWYGGTVHRSGLPRYLSIGKDIKINRFVHRTILDDKQALLIKPPLDYLNPKERDLVTLLGHTMYKERIEPFLEYIERKENNYLTENMRKYRNKVTSRMQKNRFTLISSKQIEVVKLEPKTRRFNKTLRENLNFIKRAKGRRVPALTISSHRSFNQMLLNRNKSQLFLRDLKVYSEVLEDYMEFVLYCLRYDYDFTKLFQAKRVYKEACFRHPSLLKSVLAYHSLKKGLKPFSIDNYASKIIEIEKSPYEYLIGLIEEKVLSIGSIYSPLEEILAEANNKTGGKGSITDTEPLSKELLVFKDYKINHISNTHVLQSVGSAMSHCVGGYGESLISRDRLFFDVYDNRNKRYTLSVRHSEEDERIFLSFDQFKMKANKNPSQRVKKDIVKFISLLEEGMQKEIDTECHSGK